MLVENDSSVTTSLGGAFLVCEVCWPKVLSKCDALEVDAFATDANRTNWSKGLGSIDWHFILSSNFECLRHDKHESLYLYS
jgi:hypothetical protein